MPKASNVVEEPGPSKLQNKALRRPSSNGLQKSTTKGTLETLNLLAREPAPDIEETHETISFQAIDVLGYTDPLTKRAEIHVFGVTELGNSVLVRVPHFKHYFYVPKPMGFTEEDLDPLREHLNTILKNDCILQITIEKRSFSATRFRKTTQEPWPSGAFLKITVGDYSKTKEAGQIYGKCLYKGLFETASRRTYGRSIPYHLRFTLDHKIEAMSWLKLANEEYHPIQESKKISHCQLEIWAKQEQLIVCDPAEYANKWAPLRILSFDIETLVHADRALPHPSREKVIQIGNRVSIYDGGVLQPSFVKKMFTLDSCDAIDGVQVSSFDDEKEMLSAWREFFIAADADIVIGYNHTWFDIPYLLKRAEVLGIKNFACMGRIRDDPQVLPQFEKRQYETCPGYSGRILLDLWHHYKTRFAGELKSFKLKDVAPHYLNEPKNDIDFMEIPVLQAGDSATRKELALYCLKDVELPLKLLDAKKCLEYDVNLARQSAMSYNDMRVSLNHKDFAVRWKDQECLLIDMYGS